MHGDTDIQGPMEIETHMKVMLAVQAAAMEEANVVLDANEKEVLITHPHSTGWTALLDHHHLTSQHRPHHQWRCQIC